VGASGAGPYYGLAPLPGPPEGPSPLAAPFQADARTPNEGRHDGFLVLAEQGCGYRSVLPLDGPHRFEVMADMREAHEGFQPEAASFLAWYEEWLERALAEWAGRELPVLLAGGERGSPAIAAAAPILERLAGDPRTPYDELYPTSRGDRLGALANLRIYQGRHDEALAMADQTAALGEEEPEARRQLMRARVFADQGRHAEALAAAEAGLAAPDLWFATRGALGEVREKQLMALGRRADAIAAKLARARDAAQRFSFYDVACLLFEDGDVDATARVLFEVAERGIDCDRALPVSERIAAAADEWFAAMADEDAARLAAVRARLAEKARPS
jgi:hypothetical protein